MCGVAVLLGPELSSSRALRGMCDALRHRGPDDAGYVFFNGHHLDPLILGDQDTPAEVFHAQLSYTPKYGIDGASLAEAQVAMGHRRLAIVDLSPHGHQPMCYGNARYWVTFNGQIYNYQELRIELGLLGHRLTSQSDTEVLLAAYAQWGDACLERFNGMWGFAILDRAHRTLFLARDRFGVKPLYTWISPSGELAIASEIKAFSVLRGWEPQLNGQRAYDFLAWGTTDHTAETMFKGVYQLPPGHSATLMLDKWQRTVGADGRLPVTQWYRPQARSFDGNFDAAVSLFREHFSESIKLRLRADVRVGYSLSGGLDSSSIVCVANQLLRKQGQESRPSTITMCADGETFNERPWADHVVRHTGAIANFVTPASNYLFDALSVMTWHQDEPFGSPAVLGQWSVCQEAASASLKVLLGGHGSDEILAGYGSFYALLLAKFAREGRILTYLREGRQVQQSHGYDNTYLPKILLHALLPKTLQQIGKSVLGLAAGTPSWLDIQRLGAVAKNPLAANEQFGLHATTGLSLSNLTRFPIPMILRYEDRSSMAHAIESRTPFLDYKLVEFALGVPDAFKMQNGMGKRLLREAMAGILPDAIYCRRDKIGMGTPNEKWIVRNNPEKFRAQMAKAVCVAQGVLRPQCLSYADKVLSGKAPFDLTLWRMLSFGAWIERFGVSV